MEPNSRRRRLLKVSSTALGGAAFALQTSARAQDPVKNVADPVPVVLSVVDPSATSSRPARHPASALRASHPSS